MREASVPATSVFCHDFAVRIVLHTADALQCGTVIPFLLVLQLEVKIRSFDLRLFQDACLLLLFQFVLLIGFHLVVHLVGHFRLWFQKGLRGGLSVTP